MLDLLIIFVPYLPTTQSETLFSATATVTMLEHSDATLQKKSYRVLARLIEAGKVGDLVKGENLEELVKKLDEVGRGLGPGAQRVNLSPRAVAEHS